MAQTFTSRRQRRELQAAAKADETEIINLHLNGYQIDHIADQVGWTEEAILKLLKRFGVEG
jgi:hypothetical protein